METFRPGVAGIARLYRSTPHVSREELMQEGVVGLLRALKRYDPDIAPFWAYASWWVRQAMQQLVSELGRWCSPTARSGRLARAGAPDLDEAAGDRDGSTTTLCDLIANPVRAHDGLDGEQQTPREIAGGMGLSVASAFASSRSARSTSCEPSWTADPGSPPNTRAAARAPRHSTRRRGTARRRSSQDG